MLSFHRCSSDDADFVWLIERLDADLRVRNGEGQNEYDSFNRVSGLPTAVVAKVDGLPAACGCFKEYDAGTVELKRIYVMPEFRKQGIAGRLLGQLESWAEELGYRGAVLETGLRQTEAIRLYEKAGYRRAENYGQYAGMENSVCFKKPLGKEEMART